MKAHSLFLPLMIIDGIWFLRATDILPPTGTLSATIVSSSKATHSGNRGSSCRCAQYNSTEYQAIGTTQPVLTARAYQKWDAFQEL